ncbi:unnamed protein product [Arabis nemorensis]|uniref:Uncharacterized protein n=1 Tax=Arabis nemorensis TaxID=586526 RepID=A0A565B6E2_9BRAS|nr:unnamed protein product [Arabis nemorensis]
MEEGRIGGDEVGEETKKLSEVVKECVSRWYKETLKEAQDGDIKMQALVSQMYFNGYDLLSVSGMVAGEVFLQFRLLVKNTQATVLVTRIRDEFRVVDCTQLG